MGAAELAKKPPSFIVSTASMQSAWSLDDEPINSNVLCQQQTFLQCICFRHWHINHMSNKLCEAANTPPEQFLLLPCTSAPHIIIKKMHQHSP
jgi:hypothetical protein